VWYEENRLKEMKNREKKNIFIIRKLIKFKNNKYREYIILYIIFIIIYNIKII